MPEPHERAVPRGQEGGRRGPGEEVSGRGVPARNDRPERTQVRQARGYRGRFLRSQLY